MLVEITKEMQEKIHELNTFYNKMYEDLGGVKSNIRVDIEKEVIEDKDGNILGVPIVIFTQNRELYYDTYTRILGYISGDIINFMGSKEFIIDNASFDKLVSELFKFDLYDEIINLIYATNSLAHDMVVLDHTCTTGRCNRTILDIIADIKDDIIKYIKEELNNEKLLRRVPSDLLLFVIHKDIFSRYPELDRLLIKMYKNILHMIINKLKEESDETGRIDE